MPAHHFAMLWDKLGEKMVELQKEAKINDDRARKNLSQPTTDAETTSLYTPQRATRSSSISSPRTAQRASLNQDTPSRLSVKRRRRAPVAPRPRRRAWLSPEAPGPAAPKFENPPSFSGMVTMRLNSDLLQPYPEGESNRGLGPRYEQQHQHRPHHEMGREEFDNLVSKLTGIYEQVG